MQLLVVPPADLVARSSRFSRPFRTEVICYQATGLGPVEALNLHVGSPFTQTLFNNLGQCVLDDSVDFSGVTISTPCLWPQL